MAECGSASWPVRFAWACFFRPKEPFGTSLRFKVPPGTVLLTSVRFVGGMSKPGMRILSDLTSGSSSRHSPSEDLTQGSCKDPTIRYSVSGRQAPFHNVHVRYLAIDAGEWPVMSQSHRSDKGTANWKTSLNFRCG